MYILLAMSLQAFQIHLKLSAKVVLTVYLTLLLTRNSSHGGTKYKCKKVNIYGKELNQLFSPCIQVFRWQ